MKLQNLLAQLFYPDLIPGQAAMLGIELREKLGSQNPDLIMDIWRFGAHYNDAACVFLIEHPDAGLVDAGSDGRGGMPVRRVMNDADLQALGKMDDRDRLSAARLLLDGHTVKANQGAGLKLLQVLSDAGDPSAPDLIGLVFHQGLYGKQQNASLAIMEFHKAIDRGNLSAVYHLGVLCKDYAGQLGERAVASPHGSVNANADASAAKDYLRAAIKLLLKAGHDGIPEAAGTLADLFAAISKRHDGMTGLLADETISRLPSIEPKPRAEALRDVLGHPAATSPAPKRGP